MKKTQSGFTLIELIVVIVLLGILGVTALGRFQDLSGDAAQAAVEGIASEITGSANVAYAKGLVGNTTVCIGSGASAASPNCDGSVVIIDTADDSNNFPTAGAGAVQSCPPDVLSILQSVPATVNNQAVAVTPDGADQCAGGAGTSYTCTITAGAASATATLVCTE